MFVYRCRIDCRFVCLFAYLTFIIVLFRWFSTFFWSGTLLYPFFKKKKKKHFGGTLTNKIVLEPLYPIRFLFQILSIFRPQPRMFLCILEYLGVSISKSISFKICFFSHFTAIVVGYLHTLCINNTTLNH